MDAISYSTARANLASTMDRVCEDREPLIITRNGQPSVVMLSLEDYKALEETAHLLRSPTCETASAERLGRLAPSAARPNIARCSARQASKSATLGLACGSVQPAKPRAPNALVGWRQAQRGPTSNAPAFGMRWGRRRARPFGMRRTRPNPPTFGEP